MYKINIQIMDEDGVVEDQLKSEEEATERYLELVAEQFKFVGVVKIVQLLKEIY